MTDTTTILDVPVHLGPPVVRGALHLYPITAPDRRVDGPAYVPGPSAISQFEVTELDGGGSVPELDVVNHAGRPLLLIEGETLVGGLQNRTLNVSVLVPVGTKTRIPVSCVEAGRWGSHRAAARSPRHAPTQLRARKTDSVRRSVQSGRGRRSDQGDVWSSVADYARDLDVASPSEALEDVQAAAAPTVEALVGDLRPGPDQVGVVAAVAGRPVALELFDDPATLAAYWDGLARGYALDAVGADPNRPARPDRALRLLRRAAKAAVTETAGVGLGSELHLDGEKVTGTGLRWDGRLRHLAVFRRVAA